MTATKNRIAIAGVVRRVELRRSVDRYAGVKKWRPRGHTNEDYVYNLDVTIEADDGRTYRFFTPGAEFTINCPVGCPIAVWIFKANDWVKCDNEKTLGGYSGSDKDEPLIRPAFKVGDRINIAASVKPDGKFTRVALIKEPV